jgi:hypothetical protein
MDDCDMHRLCGRQGRRQAEVVMVFRHILEEKKRRVCTKMLYDSEVVCCMVCEDTMRATYHGYNIWRDFEAS